jgi:predicted DNA-binding transcriptional regulator AlpA
MLLPATPLRRSLQEELIMDPYDTTSPDDLLLLPEVAKITRRSVDTLRWLRHKGEGPAGFRMGRRLVFRRGAVMEWIAAQEREQIGNREPTPAA